MHNLQLTRRHLIAAGAGLAVAASTGVATSAGEAGRTNLMEYFFSFSVEATGFARPELESTGQGAVYFNKVLEILGVGVLEELLEAYRDYALKGVLLSPKLGPIARNIVKLWYVATWDRLPREWEENYGVLLNDRTLIIGPEAYKSGLLWPAIGARPPGANAPGYGSWSNSPNVIK